MSNISKKTGDLFFQNLLTPSRANMSRFSGLWRPVVLW